MKSNSWPDLEPEALAAYAQTQGVAVPEAYLPAVLENLAALQVQARAVAARLETEAAS